MTSYGQFCPVAKAMELLDERWTILVIRELLSGSTHFNDLRRGLPRMSPTLLSKRLHTLTRAGITQRLEDSDGRTSYTLTQCGRELIDVVTALGTWSVRWIGDLGDEDLDPHLLMWDVRRTVPVGRWPTGRTVVEFQLRGVVPKASRWWLIVCDDRAEMCDFDPGYDVAATVSVNLRELTRIWRGDVSWACALRGGTVIIEAPREVRRAVPGWVGQSTLAAVARPASDQLASR
jgi:DNA-binding HxlR family transcriptional regulator